MNRQNRGLFLLTLLSMVYLQAATSSSTLAQSAYSNAVLSSNPVVYWNFNEESGNALEQVLGNATAQMIPMGNASRTTSGTTGGGASLGNAAVLDGTAGTRFQAADILPGLDFLPTQRWAVEFWVNLGSQGQAYISETYATPGSPSRSNNPGVIYGFMPGFELFGGGGRTGTAAPVPLSTGEWHHVVAAFYGNSSGFADNLREVYIDGVLSLSDTSSAFSAGHGLNEMAIGNAVAPNENPAPLMIDEYAVYELPGGGLLTDQLFVESLAAHYFVVPEPSALAMLAVAALMLVRKARR